MGHNEKTDLGAAFIEHLPSLVVYNCNLNCVPPLGHCINASNWLVQAGVENTQYNSTPPIKHPSSSHMFGNHVLILIYLGGGALSSSKEHEVGATASLERKKMMCNISMYNLCTQNVSHGQECLRETNIFLGAHHSRSSKHGKFMHAENVNRIWR